MTTVPKPAWKHWPPHGRESSRKPFKSLSWPSCCSAMVLNRLVSFAGLGIYQMMASSFRPEISAGVKDLEG